MGLSMKVKIITTIAHERINSDMRVYSHVHLILKKATNLTRSRLMFSVYDKLRQVNLSKQETYYPLIETCFNHKSDVVFLLRHLKPDIEALTGIAIDQVILEITRSGGDIK